MRVMVSLNLADIMTATRPTTPVYETRDEQLKTVAAREAGDSIKPGAQAPGWAIKKPLKPAKRATAR